MPSIERVKWFFLILAFFVSANFAFSQEIEIDDENSPEITARVARISFIRGDAQIKRSGNQDWEAASLNMPLVEGDELETNQNARLEIQFDSQKFLRLAENSSLVVSTLRDEGIAITLSQGILSLRVFDFEKDKGFFEIDAPQTTVSIQKEGLYRVDATDRNEVRVLANDGGEARVYSDSVGFTLRSGRSAKVFLDENRSGEWETANVSSYFDEWDNWVSERDAKLSSMLKNSYYDQYYDRDIYGAEELNDYGSWSSSDDYGWVWRPNQSAISSYSNWSPYRYGRWTWVNPYGWTWVNDEPWGWATYHHGRWVSDNRGWFWTPYSYNRPRRSRWQPALVAIFNIGNDVCWYPLSHRDRYNDYNRHYRRNGNRDFGSRRDDRNYQRPDFRRLPENSIVGIRSDEFGRRRHNVRSISSQTARQTIERNGNEIARLPRFEDRRQDMRRDSGIRRSQSNIQTRTGAMLRKAGVESDRNLQNERFRNTRREERRRQPENTAIEIPNQPENNGSRRVERSERRNGDSNSERQNPPTRIIVPMPETRQNPTNNDSERRNAERQNRNRDDERRVNIPQNNNSGENSRRSRIRNKDSENNEVRTDNSQENRPTYPPRNNENRRPNPPARTEEPRARPETPRQERQEPRREERREQPRQETRREERKSEERREQPRQEQRREQPKVEQKEQPRREREERRSTPRKTDPIDN